MAVLKITLRRSASGRQEYQKRTVKALGLRKLHQTVTHEDNPSVRGMINAIAHLVEVEEVTA